MFLQSDRLGLPFNCVAYWCIILGKEQSTSVKKKTLLLLEMTHSCLLVQRLHLTVQGLFDHTSLSSSSTLAAGSIAESCLHPKAQHRAWHVVVMFGGTPGVNALQKLPHLWGNTVS